MSSRTEVDELKLLGLLWRESQASPRSGLTTRDLTAMAVDLADREGVSAVTIRRLATEAGVTPMALYPHIGGRAELIALMLDHVAGAVYTAEGPLDDPQWRTRVTQIAKANWASCQQHPWHIDVTPGRPVPGPGAVSKYETELRALDDMGLSDIEMDQTLTALIALVHGTARASLAAQSARAPTEHNDTDWWSSIEPSLVAAMGETERFPTASRVARALGDATGKSNDPDGAFQRGLTLFLDGLAQQGGISG